MDRKQWFIDRIGKRVFRNKTTCTCLVCKSVYDKGWLIEDENEAIYLYDMEGCAAYDGEQLMYFDTKEEVEQYEQEIIIKK